MQGNGPVVFTDNGGQLALLPETELSKLDAAICGVAGAPQDPLRCVYGNRTAASVAGGATHGAAYAACPVAADLPAHARDTGALMMTELTRDRAGPRRLWLATLSDRIRLRLARPWNGSWNECRRKFCAMGAFRASTRCICAVRALLAPKRSPLNPRVRGSSPWRRTRTELHRLAPGARHCLGVERVDPLLRCIRCTRLGAHDALSTQQGNTHRNRAAVTAAGRARRLRCPQQRLHGRAGRST
jgi:hypothetical protein